MFGLGILAALLRAKVDKSWIEKGPREIEPETNSKLSKLVPMIADVMAKEKQAYANVRVDISQRKELPSGQILWIRFQPKRSSFGKKCGKNGNGVRNKCRKVLPRLCAGSKKSSTRRFFRCSDRKRTWS